jgi:NAD(P)-dependent dehydrogenase (short-subunit alcohol dehydrogenase family)
MLKREYDFQYHHHRHYYRPFHSYPCGSQGLGRQLAINFVKEGAAGICIVARRLEFLDEVRNRLFEINPKVKVITVSADLSRQEDIERVVAITLHDFNGRLDILVNNASTIGPSPMPYLLDYPLEDFRYVINTNPIAPFILIKKVLPAMIENGGSIINVTSDAGATGYPGWGAYGISKFGIEGMSQTWAAELEGSGVRVNYVDPGNMNTAMHRAAEPDEDPRQWVDPSEDIDMPLIGRLPFLTICAARLRAKQLNQLEHKLQS